MEASTVFLDAVWPSRRSWACTRGEPYVAPEASKTSLMAASRRMAVPQRGRRRPAALLIERRGGHPQHTTGGRMRHPEVGPLGCDALEQAHRVASLTQRTTDRSSRHHASVSSSAQRRRSRASSARSSPPRRSPQRSARSLRTQSPNVPAPIPSSRATSATGLRVSWTIRTAPGPAPRAQQQPATPRPRRRPHNAPNQPQQPAPRWIQAKGKTRKTDPQRYDNRTAPTPRFIEVRGYILAWSWHPVRDLNPCYHLERVAS